MESKELKPKIGIGVYVFNNKGEILIGKRKNAHGEGMYAAPGGHLEFGESFEECAKREVFEETGIKIKNISVAGITNDVFAKENKHYVTIAMKAAWDSGTVQLKEPEKCEEWVWVKWRDFPDNLFPSAANLRKQIKDLKPPRSQKV